jgi:3-oxoacyl-[acyl-carrier-protein] synthase-3
MLSKCSGIRIVGTGAGLPLRSKSNVAVWPSTAKWVSETLGIDERRFLAPKEDLLSLCVNAAVEALNMAGVSPSEIDCIIVATSTPDLINPSMAALLHGRLGASEECASFDIQAVCAGFIYALGLVASLISSQSGKYFLLVGADKFSTITNFESRDSVFFGDGAAAMLIAADDSDSTLAVELFSQGKGWESFHTNPGLGQFKMNAPEVSKNAKEKLPAAIRSILSKSGLTVEDVAFFATHQPSKPVLDALESELSLASGVLQRNLQYRGNTASATVPLVFHESEIMTRVKPGQYVAFAAIGSGWVWGSAVLKWA